MKNRVAQFFRFEFWPFWILYIPTYFYYFFLAIKSKRSLYFTLLNNGMTYGGAFFTSKNAVLRNLTKSVLPKTILIQPRTNFTHLKQLIFENKISYPLILKPDKGERGKGVEKINNDIELQAYQKRFGKIPFLVQEYIDYPIELGVLFFWTPDGVPTISSVVQKHFCSITGNGTDSFGTLVQQQERIRHRKKIIAARFKEQWNSIPEKGVQTILEPIGNHNKGTMFLDMRYKISEDMLQWIENCAKKIPGFDYGRFDIKIKNWDAFSSSNKEDVKIMEVNGVNSEPCHIYDPHYTLLQAYKDIFYHMRIIYELSKQKASNTRSKNRLIPFLKTGCKVLLNKTLYS